MSPQRARAGSRWRFRRGLLVTLVLGTIVAATLVISPSRAVRTLESLAADPLLFGLAVACLYLVRPLLAWPTTPLAIVVGYGYGVALGVPIALLGVLVTVTPVYLAARWLVDSSAGSTLPASVPAGLDGALERTRRAVTRYYETAGPIRGVVASRLAPIPSDVATCAAATSGVGLRHLMVGTAIGELPWTVAAVVVGASAASIATGGLGGVATTLTIGCALAAALVLAGPAYRAVRDRRDARQIEIGRARAQGRARSATPSASASTSTNPESSSGSGSGSESRSD